MTLPQPMRLKENLSLNFRISFTPSGGTSADSLSLPVMARKKSMRPMAYKSSPRAVMKKPDHFASIFFLLLFGTLYLYHIKIFLSIKKRGRAIVLAHGPDPMVCFRTLRWIPWRTTLFLILWLGFWPFMGRGGMPTCAISRATLHLRWYSYGLQPVSPATAPSNDSGLLAPVMHPPFQVSAGGCCSQGLKR